MELMRTGAVAVLVMATVVAFAGIAAATDRFYPNSSATSPDGRYRVDAKSPENQPGAAQAFAGNFTYTLTDLKSNEVLWTRRQPMTREKASSRSWSRESSPTVLFITNEGLVVALLADDSILVLDPSDGRKRGEAAILDAFPQAQRDIFVSRSTAGPIWEKGSAWYFVSVAAAKGSTPKTYFVVRPYWGHRLVVDLETVEHVDLGAFHAASSAAGLAGAGARERDIVLACIAEETRAAIAALEREIAATSAEQGYRRYREVGAALASVVLLRIVEAGPLLEAIEVKDPPAGKDSWSQQPSLRAALRAVGRTPRPYVGYDFLGATLRSGSAGSGSVEPERVPVPPEVRSANAALIAAGMSVERMVELIGLPDAWLYTMEGHAVDYDIDGASPRTLRLTLSEDRSTVAGVRVITPFAFLHETWRMRDW